ncbi:hypothetical protein ASE73_04740 [Sphingomonas sp. Leaf24]|jgi:hypothetical protein|nr:hypothetical protein ASE50_04375 [Sphingomonas sp. Leaf5]KQM90837.1 hypothetical protein ASE73_04740 [Sphingomonas sp. Leaf24]KQM94104.1 hypothetical protein ASE70_11975 [Sphingomonas sp. Leaf22]
MCRTILTAGRLDMPEELGPRGEVQRFVNLGERSRVVARRWGRGGLGIEWMDMTLGVTSKSTDTRMTYVAIDRAEMLRGFADDLATRLCAIPMFGCRWLTGGPWTKVAPGWALGFFDDDHGFLIAAAVDAGGPRPVVADWPKAREWLMSEKWEQMRLLRAAGDRSMMDA